MQYPEGVSEQSRSYVSTAKKLLKLSLRLSTVLSQVQNDAAWILYLSSYVSKAVSSTYVNLLQLLEGMLWKE
jgi:hypothetical protein